MVSGIEAEFGNLMSQSIGAPGGASAGGIDGVASERRARSAMASEGMEVPSGSGGPGATNFSQILSSSMESVNTHQVEADRAIKEMIAGRTKNPHETMLLIERADASLKLAMQVRNKILDAYREIMRMQV